MLKEANHFAIYQYLHVLETHHIKHLGLALGLLWSKLNRMPLQTLVDEVIAAWLRQEDNVTSMSGPPTWKSLCEALREINQEGISVDIERNGMYMCIQLDTSARSKPVDAARTAITYTCVIAFVVDNARHSCT